MPLPATCLDDGSFLALRLARFHAVAQATATVLTTFGQTLDERERTHQTIGGDDALVDLARDLVVMESVETSAGGPLIICGLSLEDKEQLFDVAKLLDAGVQSVLVYPLQIGPRRLGRVVSLARRDLDDVLTGSACAYLESTAVQMTLGIEAHHRGQRAAHLELMFRDHRHRLSNHLSHLLDELRRQGGETFPLLLLRLEAYLELQRLIGGDTLPAGYELSAVVKMAVSKALVSLGAAERITFVVDGAMASLSLNQLEVVAAVISELAVNSVKHSWLPGVVGQIAVHLEVQERSGEKWILLHYADDGIGFPDGFAPERGGQGFGLIRSAPYHFWVP